MMKFINFDEYEIGYTGTNLNVGTIFDLENKIDRSIKIYSVDISADGFSVLTKASISKEKMIRFEICVSDIVYEVVAKVLWTQKEELGYWSGLDVEYMPEELLNEIEDLLRIDNEPKYSN